MRYFFLFVIALALHGCMHARHVSETAPQSHIDSLNHEIAPWRGTARMRGGALLSFKQCVVGAAETDFSLRDGMHRAFPNSEIRQIMIPDRNRGGWYGLRGGLIGGAIVGAVIGGIVGNLAADRGCTISVDDAEARSLDYYSWCKKTNRTLATAEGALIGVAVGSLSCGLVGWIGGAEGGYVISIRFAPPHRQ
jgi:hypothetical protein